jgi:hypothetical protein
MGGLPAARPETPTQAPVQLPELSASPDLAPCKPSNGRMSNVEGPGDLAGSFAGI